jgi:glutathione synthase/RimK-type ligase-like ATP-grasp enzyme
MRIFDPEVARSLGTYIVSMDLDTVVLDNLEVLWSDRPDFRIVQGGGKRNCYNGSMWAFRPGVHSEIWTRFNPEEAAHASSVYMGSDQAWMRHVLGDGAQVWNSSHGVLQFANLRGRVFPPDTRVVFFAGGHKPWHHMVQRANKWIVKEWGESTDSGKHQIQRVKRRYRQVRRPAVRETLKVVTDLPVSQMPDIKEVDPTMVTPPHRGGKFWIFDDSRGWGFALFLEAMKSGWDAQMFTSGKEVTDLGYVFMIPDQPHETLEHQKKTAHALHESGNVVIPPIEMIMEYEDKALQYDQYREWMPRTHVFYNVAQALEHAKIRSYPCITKAKSGSGSKAVEIHKDQRSLVTHIHTAFSSGIPIHMGELQRGYVIVQDFLPNNSYAYRVVAIGSERLVFRILNRPDQPLASGSGLIDHSNYDAEAQEVLAFADKFFAEFGVGWCAADIVFDSERMIWRVLETSVAWNMHKPWSNLSRRFTSGRPVAFLFEILCEQIAGDAFST